MFSLFRGKVYPQRKAKKIELTILRFLINPFLIGVELGFFAEMVFHGPHKYTFIGCICATIEIRGAPKNS